MSLAPSPPAGTTRIWPDGFRGRTSLPLLPGEARRHQGQRDADDRRQALHRRQRNPQLRAGILRLGPGLRLREHGVPAARLRSYDVAIGKPRAGEVDFVAASGDTRVCVQVTENMTEPATMGRELKPLRAIRDAHPKAVMAMRGIPDRGRRHQDPRCCGLPVASQGGLRKRRTARTLRRPALIRSTSLLVALPSNRLLVLLVQTVPLVGANGLRTHR